MRALVRFEGVIADRVDGIYHRIPGSVLAVSTLPNYCSEVIVSCYETPKEIKAFLLATERELKPWYPSCPLNSDCRLTDEKLEDLLASLNKEDVFITSSEEEARYASRFGIVTFLLESLLNPGNQFHIRYTNVYAVPKPELRNIPGLIKRLQGARAFLGKYRINPLDCMGAK